MTTSTNTQQQATLRKQVGKFSGANSKKVSFNSLIHLFHFWGFGFLPIIA